MYNYSIVSSTKKIIKIDIEDIIRRYLKNSIEYKVVVTQLSDKEIEA